MNRPRHYRCAVCDVGRLLIAEPFPNQLVVSCSNLDCSTHGPVLDWVRRHQEDDTIARGMRRLELPDGPAA